MKEEIMRRLIEEAKDMANKNDCCPDTRYTVGAALLTTDGKVYKGFNIENDGILSICAERVAFVKALSEGCREFKAIAIMGRDLDSKHFNKTFPCGYCRHFMRDYTKDGFIIICYDEDNDKIETYTIEELLPNSFVFRKD